MQTDEENQSTTPTTMRGVLIQQACFEATMTEALEDQDEAFEHIEILYAGMSDQEVINEFNKQFD